MDNLVKLPPAFVPKNGKVTAGNSSGINDGSSAMVIMSGDKAKELGIQPIAKIRATGKGACHPSVMGLSPVPAVKDLLDKNPGLTLEDFELIELNEAFAAQGLAVLRQLGVPDDAQHVNAQGGAIAIGHPLGMSGARLALTALLVRVARSDHDYAASEVALIDQITAGRYGLTPDQAQDLRSRAETLESEAPDTVRFTRAIKDAVDDLDFTQYDLVYMAGGWGAAYDLGTSEVLGRKISEAYAGGAVLGSGRSSMVISRRSARVMMLPCSAWKHTSLPSSSIQEWGPVIWGRE